VALAWPFDTMHTTSTLILILAVFGASSVEMVEALTIVVAAGVSRGWRSALEGAATAVVVLALLVGFIGVPLIHYVPIDTLRVVVGALLLVLGLAWLRKAILRASGHKAPHDEDRIYAETVAELSEDGSGDTGGAGGEGAGKTRDGVAFAVAFKGVFLEGTEVVLIVVSLGASQGRLGLAALSAGAAAVVVAGVGVLVARQLSEVPENTIKTVVGVMLTSFGVFWVGEGAGVRWPGSDLAILGLVGFFVLVTLAATAWMRSLLPVPTSVPSSVPSS
jgi:Ca2+/H+ antiporter, TMEM165/GDT1 family